MERYCNRCDNKVSKSELEEYSFQCFDCDEDLYEFETYIKTKVTYNKVDRAEAKKLWNNGDKIYLLPSKVEYVEGIGISVSTDKNAHKDFDIFVDEYRNLTSKTGLSRMSFYIESH